MDINNRSHTMEMYLVEKMSMSHGERFRKDTTLSVALGDRVYMQNFPSS